MNPIAGTTPDSSLLAMNIPSLIDHILARYHELHRRELPGIIALARKVETVHRDMPDAPLGLADTLERLSEDLEAHMKKEELVLFPAMREGAQEGISGPISVMRGDHEDHGRTIQMVKELASGFAVPDGACNSWRSLYAAAEKLCSDILEHIQVENSILFPRFELTAKSGCICSHD